MFVYVFFFASEAFTFDTGSVDEWKNLDSMLDIAIGWLKKGNQSLLLALSCMKSSYWDIPIRLRCMVLNASVASQGSDII